MKINFKSYLPVAFLISVLTPAYAQKNIILSPGYQKLPDCLNIQNHPFSKASHLENFQNPSSGWEEITLNDLAPTGAVMICLEDQGSRYVMTHQSFFMTSPTEGVEILSDDMLFQGNSVVPVILKISENELI